MSIASFLGIGAGWRRSSTSAAAKSADDETDEDMKARHARETEERDEADESEDDMKARHAQERQAAGFDPPAAKAKRAKKDDGDETDDAGEDKEDQDAEDEPDEEGKRAKRRALRAERRRAATLAERARCAAIFATPAAAKNVQLAAHLAFNTDLSVTAAAAALDCGGAVTTAGGLGARMQGLNLPNPGPGGAAAQPARASIQAGWDKAHKEAWRFT